MQGLNQKLEQAAKALIEATVTDYQVFTGLIQQSKVLPRITAAVTNGTEFPLGSGNFTLSLSVEMRSNADDTTEQQHQAACETALAPMMSDSLASELSAAGTAFHAFGVSNLQSSHGVEERSFVTTLTMDVYCCGQTLS